MAYIVTDQQTQRAKKILLRFTGVGEVNNKSCKINATSTILGLISLVTVVNVAILIALMAMHFQSQSNWREGITYRINAAQWQILFDSSVRLETESFKVQMEYQTNRKISMSPVLNPT